MKTVLLRADGPWMAYSVPDCVADHLKEYCIEFCDGWLRTNPDAAKYRMDDLISYDESDFIEYLNRWQFPEEPSEFLENLGFPDSGRALPEAYRNCPRFNF